MLWKVFWLGLFTAAAVYVFNFLIAMDMNKKAYNQRPGPCRKLNGVEYGSEDFAVVESLGLVFITSGMWFLNPRPTEAKGRIFLFDFNRTEEDPVELELAGLPSPEKFRPHGISHWQEGATVFLYVISHQPPDFEHSVEVFRYETGEKKLLQYVKTLEDKKFVRPNTLVAVGKDQFIVANDGAAQSQLKMLFEFLLGKKAGSICYFDGKESHWLAEGLSSTTAVATDRAGKHLLVGQVNEKAIAVFALSENFKSMKEVSRLELKTAPDNFYVDEENVIWIGAHPVVGQLFTHVGQADDLKSYAPSQVLRVAYSKDWKSAEIQQVFMDDGRLISASSVAAFYRGKLLVGSMAREAVLCDVLYDKFE